MTNEQRAVVLKGITIIIEHYFTSNQEFQAMLDDLDAGIDCPDNQLDLYWDLELYRNKVKEGLELPDMQMSDLNGWFIQFHDEMIEPINDEKALPMRTPQHNMLCAKRHRAIGDIIHAYTILNEK